MATEARDPTGPGGTTSGGTRAGDRAARAGGRDQGGRGRPLGSSGRTGPRDPVGPSGNISGGTPQGDRAATAGGKADGGRLSEIAAVNVGPRPTGLLPALEGLINPTPTPITGNPFFDAVVSQVPVIGPMIALTKFLQDLGVPSAPPASSPAYQAAQARQVGGIGATGEQLRGPNPLLSALVRPVQPAPVAPAPVMTPGPPVVPANLMQPGATAAPQPQPPAPPPFGPVNLFRR